MLARQLLQASVIEGVERLGASANVAVADEELRDRGGACDASTPCGFFRRKSSF
jgi:hypothetical protein